jgi:hypothetical protein
MRSGGSRRSRGPRSRSPSRSGTGLEEEEEIVPEDVDVDDRACCGKVPGAADVVDAAACSPDVDVMKPFCGVN